MQQFYEIKANQLEPGKEYSFSQPLIIFGDIPHNVIIKVTAGLLRIEGSLQDKVSLQCDDLITINGDVGPGCYLTGRNIIVLGNVMPGMFTAMHTIEFVGKVTYKVQMDDGEWLEMLLMAPNIIVPPLKNDQPPSSTSVNKRARDFFGFFESPKRLRIATVDEIAISSTAGELNKLTQPKNIPPRFKGLVQGIPYMHKKLFELHQKVNANQPPTFTVYGKKGKQIFTLKEHQLRALTEICNNLMRANMQHTPNLFKAVLELPTGAGKTLIFLLLISLLTEESEHLENPPFHILVVEPFVDLKNQTKKRSKEFSPNLTIADYIKGQAPATVVTTVTYQMLARLAKELPPAGFENFIARFDGVIFDEAHNIFAELSRDVLNAVLKLGALTILVSATAIKDESNSLYKLLGYANPGEESLPGEEINPLSHTTTVNLIKKRDLAPIKAAIVDLKLTNQTQLNLTQEQAQQLEDSEEDLEFLNDPKNLKMLISILVNKGFLGLGGIIRSRNNKNAQYIVDAIEKFCDENAELIEPMIAPMRARYEANIEEKVEKAVNKATQEGKPFDVNAYRASFPPFKIIAACTSATITNPTERKSFSRLLKMGSPLWTVGDKMIVTGKDNPWWKVAIPYSPFLSWIAFIQFFGRIFRVWNNQIAYPISINWGYSNQLFYPSAINGKMQVGDFTGTANIREYPDIDVGEKTEYSLHWELGNLQIRVDRTPFQSRNSRPSARRPQRIQEQEEKISQELMQLENVLKQFEEMLEKELPEIQEKKSSLIAHRQRSTAPARNEENQIATAQETVNREETMEIEPQPTTISSTLEKRINSLTAMAESLWDAMQKESDEEDSESEETIKRPKVKKLRPLTPVQAVARKLHGLKQQLKRFLQRQHGATATSEIQDEDSAMEREDVRDETGDILGDMLNTLESIRRQWNEQQLSSLVTQVVTQRNASLDQQSAMEVEPIIHLDLNANPAIIAETAEDAERLFKNKETEPLLIDETKPLPSNDVFYISEDDFKEFAEEVDSSLRRLSSTKSVSLDFKEWLNKKYPGKTRYGLEEESQVKNLSFIGLLDLSQMLLRNVFFERLTVGGMEILGAKFFKADLEGSTLSDVSLPYANFKEANLQSIVASQVNWSGGDFKKANLSSTVIKNSTLKGATFEGTRCINTRFFKVNLENIKLVNSDFSDAIFINCQMSFLADPMNFNFKNTIFYKGLFISTFNLQSLAKQGFLAFNSVSEVEKKIKSLLIQTAEISSHKKSLERLFCLVKELLDPANASLLGLTAEEKTQLEELLQQQEQSELPELETAMDIETTVAESSENARKISTSNDIFDIKVEDFQEYADQHKKLRQTDKWPDFRKWLNQQYKVNIEATTLLRLPEHSLIEPNPQLVFLKLYKLDMSDMILKKVNFRSLKLFKAKLERVEASDSSFMDVDLNKSRFNHAVLESAVFKRGSLTEANFTKATLLNATFKYSNLAKVNFTNANCDGMCLLGVDLTQVQAGAYFSGAIFIECQNIKSYLYSKVENAVFYKCSFNTSSTMESMVINSVAEISQKISFYENLIDELSKESTTAENTGKITSYKKSLEMIFRLIKKLQALYKEGVLKLTLEENTELEKLLQQQEQRESSNTMQIATINLDLKENPEKSEISTVDLTVANESPSVAAANQEVPMSDDIFDITVNDFHEFSSQRKIVLNQQLMGQPNFQEWLHQKYGKHERYGLADGSRLENLTLWGIFNLRKMVIFNLRKMVMKKAIFNSVNMLHADCKEVEMEGSQFLNVLASHVDFNSADLRSIMVKNGDWGDVKFGKADCINAIFINVSLNNSNFGSANFSEAIFIGCQMNCNFVGAKFEYAIFYKCSDPSKYLPFLNGIVIASVDDLAQKINHYKKLINDYRALQAPYLQGSISAHEKFLERLFRLVNILLSLDSGLELTAKDKENLAKLLETQEISKPENTKNIVDLSDESAEFSKEERKLLPAQWTLEPSSIVEHFIISKRDFKNVETQNVTFINGTIEDSHFDYSNLMFAKFIDVTIRRTSFKDALILGAEVDADLLMEQLRIARAITTVAEFIERVKVMFSDPQRQDLVNARYRFLNLLQQIADNRYPKITCTAAEQLQIDNLSDQMLPILAVPTLFDFANYQASGQTNKLDFKQYIEQKYLSEAKSNNVRVANSTLKKLALKQITLKGIIFSNIQFSGVDFAEASLSRMKLYACTLVDTNFRGANLFRSRCINSFFQKVSFIGAYLEWASFKESIFWDVNFNDADVANADFSHATFFNCDFRGIKNFNLSKVQNTVFYKCKFDGLKPIGGNEEDEWLFMQSGWVFIPSLNDVITLIKLNYQDKTTGTFQTEHLQRFSYICLFHPQISGLMKAAAANEVAELKKYLHANPITSAGNTPFIINKDLFVAEFREFVVDSKFHGQPLSAFQQRFKERHNIPAKFNLCLSPGTEITDQDLSGIDMNKMELVHVSFTNLKLNEANLQQVQARYAEFKDVDLTKADLSGSNFEEAYFEDVNFQGVIVTPATDFSNAMFINCNISYDAVVSLKLIHAIFFNCRFLQPIEVLKDAGAIIISSIDDISPKILFYKKLIQELSKDLTKNAEKIASRKEAIEMIFRLVEKLLSWSAELKLTFEGKLKLETLKVEYLSNEPTVVPDKQKTAKLSFDGELKAFLGLQNYKISDRDFTGLIAEKMRFENVDIDNASFNCADLMHLKLIDVTINGTSLNGANMMFAEFNNLTLGEEVSLKDVLILGATFNNGSKGVVTKMLHGGAIFTISGLIQRTTAMFSNPQIEDPTNRRQVFLTVLQQIVDEEYPTTLKCDPEEEQQINNLLARFQPKILTQVSDFKTRNFKRMRFYTTKFTGFDFAEVDFSGAMFFYCNLIGAKNLKLAKLHNTIFFGCKMVVFSKKNGAKSPLFFSSIDDLIVNMQRLEKAIVNSQDLSQKNIDKILLERLRIFSYIYLSYRLLSDHNPSGNAKLENYLNNSTQKSIQPLVTQPTSENVAHIQSADLIAAFKTFKLENKVPQWSAFQEYLRKQQNLEPTAVLCLSPETQIANEDLSYMDFSNMELKEVIFSNCKFSGARFTNVKARTGSFLDCELDFAFLTNAKFNEVYMQNVNLKDAIAGKVDLSNGVFLWVDLSTTKQLGTANLTNTTFFNCKFPFNTKLNVNILAVNSVDELFKKFSSNHLELSTLQKRQIEMTHNPGFFTLDAGYRNLPERIKLLNSIKQRLVRLANCLNACMEKPNNPEKFSESEKEQIKTILSITKKPVPKELSSDGSSFTLQL